MTVPERIDGSTSQCTASPAQAVIAVRVLDDAHLTWRAAEIECEFALRAWMDADTPQAADAYLAYHAALDREEAAAHDLQRLSELTQPSQEQVVRGQG